MFKMLWQLPTIDLTVILWISMAFSVLGLLLTVRTIASMRRSRDRRMLVGLVLDMLEQGIAPEDITALLRAMGLHRHDERFSAIRRRLFRRYTKRKATARSPEPAVITCVARRELQAV